MSLKKQTISGVKWTSTSTIILAIISIVKLSFLTRYLDKSDFGIMALITFVLGFVSIFMNLGFNSAILHRQNITKNEYYSIYWMNSFFSIILYLIIIIIAPFIEDFYKLTELGKLIQISGLSILFASAGGQFKTIEQKKLNFKFISIVDVLSGCGSLCLALFLAIKGLGVYALVLSFIFQYFFSNVVFLIYGLKQEGLKFHYKYFETKPFLKIGLYQVGGQVINYFNRDLDVIIIGKAFGADILGGYSLAKQLVLRPASIFNPILTRVAAPVLAQIQKNKKNLTDNYLKLLNIGSTINFIIYAGIIIFADIIVNVLYGVEYKEIVILVRILSVYMYLRFFGNITGTLVTATGRNKLEFKWNFIMLFILPIIIFIGSQFNILIVTILLVVSRILLIIPFWSVLVRRIIDVELNVYLKALLPSPKKMIEIIKHIIK